MLYVTHDQEEAMSLGDRLVVMHEGRVQQVGPPMEIYTRPVNQFVAGFVGSPAMAMIEGEITERDGRPIFETAAGAVVAGPDLDRTEHRGRVTLGVRPEAWRLTTAEDRRLSGEVVTVERYGDRGDAIVEVKGGQRIVHRGPALEMPDEGIKIGLEPIPGGVHFFDARSGDRLEG